MQPYLYEHQNPNSRRRANGLRFWGYPEANSPKSAVVLHTAEINPSPASAWNIADYFTHSTRPASYHRIVDSDNSVLLIPDEGVSFNTRGFNSPSLGLSWATRAAWWGRFPAWDEEALWKGARVAAEWSDKFDIPVRPISRSQAKAGVRGFTTHALMDPSRRSDPGAGFPLKEFFRRVKELLGESFDEELDVLEIGDVGDPVVRYKWDVNLFLHKDTHHPEGLPVHNVFDEQTRAYTHHIQHMLNWKKYPGKVDSFLSNLLHELTSKHEPRK